MKKSCVNKRNPSRLCPKTGQAREDKIFYAKGLLIMLIWTFGIFGSLGAVDMDFISARQALKQIGVSLALTALIAYTKEVLRFGYQVLFRLYKAAQSLSRDMRGVHRAKGRGRA